MDLLGPARQEAGGAGEERSCSYDENRTSSDEAMVAAEVTPLILILDKPIPRHQGKHYMYDTLYNKY